jgi:hypothetical protein
VSDRDDSEREERKEFFEAEDELLGGPPPPANPYTPEPGPRPGDQRAFNVLRLAWIVIAILVIAIIIYLLFD